MPRPITMHGITAITGAEKQTLACTQNKTLTKKMEHKIKVKGTKPRYLLEEKGEDHYYAMFQTMFLSQNR